MIEAVGHAHLGEFMEAAEMLLAPGGILVSSPVPLPFPLSLQPRPPPLHSQVMEIITTPECRYQECLGAADFINTVIFPGSCCPSMHAMLNAMEKHSNFSLERLDNIK